MRGSSRGWGALAVLVGVMASVRGLAQPPVEEVPDPIDAVRIAEALERYALEPRVDELLAALDDHPGLDLRAARRLARRSRRGGWLPQVRLGVRRGQQRDLTTQLVDEDSTRLSADDDLTLEATLTLRLDRAAYGEDELSTLREVRQRAVLRDDRAQLLIAFYFERRRLQLERDLLDQHDVATELRIHELQAMLDALTRGAFTRIQQRRH